MVLERLKEMIAEKMYDSSAEVTAESELTDLGLDSLDIMEMVTDIEDEFDVLIDAETDLGKYHTVGALAERIEELQNE